MLRKTLAFCILTVCAFIGLQAIEREVPPSTDSTQQIIEENTEKLAGCKRCRDKHISLSCGKCKGKHLAGCKKCKDKHLIVACNDEPKVLSPGALVCNEKEDSCTKEG